MTMPKGAPSLHALNNATSGNLLDFAGYCRQHGFTASVVVQTEGLHDDEAVLHLHAANAFGRTTHFESHQLTGRAAKAARDLKNLSPDLTFRFRL
jgi:hypothetical protein